MAGFISQRAITWLKAESATSYPCLGAIPMQWSVSNKVHHREFLFRKSNSNICQTGKTATEKPPKDKKHL